MTTPYLLQAAAHIEQVHGIWMEHGEQRVLSHAYLHVLYQQERE